MWHCGYAQHPQGCVKLVSGFKQWLTNKWKQKTHRSMQKTVTVTIYSLTMPWLHPTFHPERPLTYIHFILKENAPFWWILMHPTYLLSFGKFYREYMVGNKEQALKPTEGCCYSTRKSKIIAYVVISICSCKIPRNYRYLRQLLTLTQIQQIKEHYSKIESKINFFNMPDILSEFENIILFNSKYSILALEIKLSKLFQFGIKT